MSSTVDDTGTRRTLDLWYPNCWAIETTRRGGGIFGHASYYGPRATDEAVIGAFTAYGDSDAEVRRLLGDHGYVLDRWSVAYGDDADQLLDNPEESRRYLGGADYA